MTDEEALAIAKKAEYYSGCNSYDQRPAWHNGVICLDGDFSVEQLQAMLHFAPKEPT